MVLLQTSHAINYIILENDKLFKTNVINQKGLLRIMPNFDLHMINQKVQECPPDKEINE